MPRILLALALIAPAAPALAQAVLSPGPVPDTTTCGEFMTMDSVGRLRTLTEIQPLGDEINAGDQGAAEQWSNAVAAACAGQAERLLTDAATQALGAD